MPDPVRIRNRYYLHKRVPADIVGTFAKTSSGKPKTHIDIPLDTDKWEAAKRAIPDAEKTAQVLFDAHRREIGIATAGVLEPQQQTPERACAAFHEQLREQECKRRREIAKEAKADPQSFLASQAEPLHHRLPPLVPCVDELHAVLAETLARDVSRRLRNAKGALAVLDLDAIRQASGESDEKLLVLLARTEIAFLEALECDAGALFHPAPKLGVVKLGSPAPIALQAVTPNGGKNPLASEAADDWLQMRLDPQGDGWSMERQGTWKEALAIFLEVCGDRPMSSYTVDDKGELQDTFRKLPAGRHKKPATRGKPIHGQISTAAQLGLPRMNAKTANEYLRMVEKFFDWCKGRYSVMQGRNVFEGSALRVAKSKTGEKPRDRFDLEELKRIFANPFYGEHADTDWKYWTPLVQLYTGARSNSLLKLKVGDIRTEDGITFLDINAEEYSNASIKRTDKTAAGLRRIPLHPDLVELGFLKFVVSQKGKELLFEGLRVSKRGKFTKSYGDWFRRHLEKLGLKRKGRDTHSFRHTWDHFAEASRIESEWRDRLQGHARHGMRRVYGGKTELKLLDEEMRKLRFRGLNLSHLKR